MSWVTSMWDQWLLIAFVAPFFWAIVNIIDVYFVGSVYGDEWDGTLISCAFQIFPWFLPLAGLVVFQYPGLEVTLWALAGGATLSLAYFFYFRTLFHSNDVVVLEALKNLSVLLVPFLAWLFIQERLTLLHYAGIGLAFVGATLLVLHKQIRAQSIRLVLWSMLGVVAFLSLSMIIQRQVYTLIEDDFWTGFLLFSLGSFLMGGVLLIAYPLSIRIRLKRLFRLSRRFFLIFFCAEMLNVFAVLASQRAIDISPAVSFVSAIESTIPVFVLGLSLLLIVFFSVLNKEKAVAIYRDQLVAFKTKIAACCIIGVGIYLIS